MASRHGLLGFLRGKSKLDIPIQEWQHWMGDWLHQRGRAKYTNQVAYS